MGIPVEPKPVKVEGGRWCCGLALIAAALVVACLACTLIAGLL